MQQEIILCVIVGILWAGIGVFMSMVTRTGRSAEAFLTVDLGLTALFAWIFMVRWHTCLSSPCPRMGEMVFWMTVAGAGNSLGMLALARAMTIGHNGVAWTLAQSAMLVSFLAGVLIWKDSVIISGWLGVSFVVVAMVWLGLSTSSAGSVARGYSWVGLAFLAMVLLGAAQAMTSIPSRWPGWTDSGELRLATYLTASAIVPAAAMFAKRARIDRRILVCGSLAAVCSILSTLLLFYCLDRMARAQQAGLVFPVAVAACVLGFSLYSWFVIKEQRSWRLALGMALAAVGILLMAK